MPSELLSVIWFINQLSWNPIQFQLLLFLYAVGEIQIDQGLVRDPGLIRLLLEIVDHTAVDINRYLLLQFLGVRVFSSFGKIIFFSHITHTSHNKYYSLACSLFAPRWSVSHLIHGSSDIPPTASHIRCTPIAKTFLPAVNDRGRVSSARLHRKTRLPLLQTKHCAY